jgi:membrane-associated protein
LEQLQRFVQMFLHLDEMLSDVVRQYGVWTYAIVTLIIFAETGLVVTPILPGDSLLFAVGALAAAGVLDIKVLFVLLVAAAILGDTVNYSVGRYIGPRAFSGNIRFLKKEYLDKTHAFYEKHGGKAIILARFLPIVRTFAPFVAGIGSMTYRTFVAYNVVGGLIWISLFLFGGYFFGNIPWVKKNFEVVILVIIGLSVVPPLVEWARARFGKGHTA